MNATSDPPVFTSTQVRDYINKERKSTRRTIRKIWVVSMVLTVMISVCVRKQQFVPDLAWWVTPLVAVCVNAICHWLAIRMFFGKRM